jgi:hypothetical protein
MRGQAVSLSRGNQRWQRGTPSVSAAIRMLWIAFSQSASYKHSRDMAFSQSLVNECLAPLTIMNPRDNGKRGFVDIEQKAAGLVPVLTDLKNRHFGELAQAVGLGNTASRSGRTR